MKGLATRLQAATFLVLPFVVPRQPISLRVIREACGACQIETRRALRIGTDPDVPIIGFPLLVTADRKGRLLLLQTKSGIPDSPPLVLDESGKLLGTLGRRGQGPGETGHPEWIEAGWDDSVRLYEGNRVVTFDQNLKHVWTRQEPHWEPGLRQVIHVEDGSYVALTSQVLDGRDVVPIYRRADEGKSWLPVPISRGNGITGPWRVITRAKQTSRRLWVGQYATKNGKGYDILSADLSGRIYAAYRREPAWWVTGDATIRADPPAVSSVSDIREVAEGVLAILVRQPIPNWRRVRVDPVTRAGEWKRYETLVEVIDIKSASVRGSARARGLPRDLIDDRRIATYIEEDDGTPFVDILLFSVGR